MTLWTLKDKTILVVDDLAEMRSIMRSMLVAYGATDLHQARNGEEALDHLAARTFDLVMCDYNLGKGRDGQQILEEARHRNLLPRSTAWVMVTAENSVDMVMGALEHQPDAYLSKPIPKTILQPRLRKLFERKQRLAPIYAALDARDHVEALARCDEQLAGDGRYRFALLELRCDLLARLDRHDDVETLCESILAERELPWASLALGQVHFHRARYEQAQEVFDDLIDYNADFVEAYDWLARAQRAARDDRAAQDTLMRAVGRSPKSLPRQRALAEIATVNGDRQLAEKARRAALRVGQNSVTKLPCDYTGLAEALVANGKNREALATLESLRADYLDDDGAAFAADAAQVAVHRAAGDASRARAALPAALESYRRVPGTVASDVALGLIAACLDYEEREHADEMARQLVRNHHDDGSLLARIDLLYREAGRGDDGAALVEHARDEAVRINNEGVKLLEAGKLEESIELFTRALKGMPGNPVVNLNAAQSLAMAMQSGAVTRRRLNQAMHCLEVVGTANPCDARYRRLMSLCNQLAAVRAS